MLRIIRGESERSDILQNLARPGSVGKGRGISDNCKG